MQPLDDHALIARYLLQDVTPREQEEIERRYFSDPDYLTTIEVAEGDLIDAYVRGRLSRAQVERFEEHFLSTRARRERLEMAEALHLQIPERRTWPMPLVASAITAAVLGAVCAFYIFF